MDPLASAAPETRPLPPRGPVESLLERPPFAHGPAADRLFLEAMKEAFRHHRRACPAFDGVCRTEGFDERRCKDLRRLPFLFVAAFKERDLSSVRRRDVVLELSSSGTSGQRSRILLDAASLLRVRRIAWQVFSGLGLADRGVSADHLCFTYDPAVAGGVGTAWTDKLLTGFTAPGECFWALRWDEGTKSFRFDLEGALDFLEKLDVGGRPARLVGFPAFALRLCEEFRRKHGRPALLHPASKVITGGGWKDQQDRAVDKAVMRKALADSLSLDVSNVRDLFGMVEHGVPYVDCRLGNFHVPVYSRVLVRDPGTLEVLPFGRRGLLQFLTPYLRSYPSVSLLSSDFGSLEPRCPCGLGGPVLRVAGRAGVRKLKGCAAAAAEILR